MQNIDQDKFLELSADKEYQILDVRRPEECASGIVPGAKEIDFLNPSFFMNEINKLDKTKKYLIYCRSGNRSGKACQIMDSAGFNSTFNLKGGMLAWTGPIA